MDARSRHRLISAAAALIAAVLVAGPVSAQEMPVVLFTGKGEQIPLKTYAEFLGTGILRISSGSAKDIPTVEHVDFIRCALTGWRPGAVLITSEALFKDERSERRLTPIVIRPVGVSAVAVRAPALDDPKQVASLLKAVGVPEGGDRSYFFLILTSGDANRYYPFRLRLPASPK
jgi:hypothetical protein